MNIIAISDIHGRIDNIAAISDNLAKADLILIAGDITNFGGAKQAKQIISKIQKYNKTILAVPGNCDSPSVDEYLTKNSMSLHCNCIELNGIKFIGLGGSLPCPSLTINESPEENFRNNLAALEEHLSPDDKCILLTHQPAQGTKVDFVGNNRHLGSVAITEFIIRNQPILAVSGHIHEAVGTDAIRGTALINPGPVSRGTYGYISIDKSITVEIRTIN